MYIEHIIRAYLDQVRATMWRVHLQMKVGEKFSRQNRHSESMHKHHRIGDPGARERKRRQVEGVIPEERRNGLSLLLNGMQLGIRSEAQGHPYK